MEISKFIEETKTLKNFFELYCKNNCNGTDSLEDKTNINLCYKEKNIFMELNLCPECLRKIQYSFDKLLDCPHEIKPRCRRCPSPCYEKKQWKETAKVMRYSGIRFGLGSASKKIKELFK